MLMECMLQAGREVFGTTRKRWQQVPGWNEFVEDAHTAAREAFLEWHAHGSPRQGPLAADMRSKAFERVNYWKLFNKLLGRGIPEYLVSLLVY